MNSWESDNWPEAEEFVEKLDTQLDGMFNPWYQYCDSFDISSCAPQIRRRHLLDYFRARRCTARYLFIGEALSFNGGRFSGIAMTSERMLNDGQTKVIRACQIIPGLDPQHDASWRTSKPDACPKEKEKNTGVLREPLLLCGGYQHRIYAFALLSLCSGTPFLGIHTNYLETTFLKIESRVSMNDALGENDLWIFGIYFPRLLLSLSAKLQNLNYIELFIQIILTLHIQHAVT